ncbi:MAG TPA: phytanoyl-CoA dioxygenase family protein, partial [Polyangiaceae bacterium]
PLQPVTVENGCPQFVPKSHTWEVLPHHPIHNDPRVHGLEVDSADVSNAVTCELPAGGATVHHNRTLHHTAANTTDIPRRAYTLVFGTPAKKREIPRHLPWQHLRKTPREERRARHNSK